MERKTGLTCLPASHMHISHQVDANWLSKLSLPSQLGSLWVHVTQFGTAPISCIEEGASQGLTHVFLCLTPTMSLALQATGIYIGSYLLKTRQSGNQSLTPPSYCCAAVNSRRTSYRSIWLNCDRVLPFTAAARREVCGEWTTTGTQPIPHLYFKDVRFKQDKETAFCNYGLSSD